jgi:hypothetical protein
MFPLIPDRTSVAQTNSCPMRTKLFFFSGLMLLTAICAAQPAAAPSDSAAVTFPVYGFSINPFEMPTAGAVLQAVQMSWPILPMPSNPNQGMAPAVNVIVWPGTDNMDDYKAKEKQDLQSKGFAILHETSSQDNTGWTIEYVGVVSGAGMHWYAHVVSSTKRIFIATGIAPDEMWSLYGDKIKACVDSLKSTGTAQVVALPVTTPPPTAPAMAAPPPSPATSVTTSVPTPPPAPAMAAPASPAPAMATPAPPAATPPPPAPVAPAPAPAATSTFVPPLKL